MLERLEREQEKLGIEQEKLGREQRGWTARRSG